MLGMSCDQSNLPASPTPDSSARLPFLPLPLLILSIVWMQSQISQTNWFFFVLLRSVILILFHIWANETSTSLIIKVKPFWCWRFTIFNRNWIYQCICDTQFVLILICLLWAMYNVAHCKKTYGKPISISSTHQPYVVNRLNKDLVFLIAFRMLSLPTISALNIFNFGYVEIKAATNTIYCRISQTIWANG